jgi:opacity protein-like surface antigen
MKKIRKELGMKKISLLATVMSVLALPAFAADTNLSYTFAEFGFTDRDFDGPSADGFILNGSYEITDLIFAYGGYSDLSGDGDTTTLEIGGGIAIPFNDMIDGYAKLGYLSNDLGPIDDTGFGLEIGARAMVVEKVEAFGNIKYVDIYNDNDTIVEVGGRYWHMDNLGFSASYTDGDFMGSGLSVAARYNF